MITLLPYPGKQKINGKQSTNYTSKREARQNYENQNKRKEKIQHMIYNRINKILGYTKFVINNIIKHIVSPRSITERYQATNSMSRII